MEDKFISYKKLILACFAFMILVFSISSVQASDVNMTDNTGSIGVMPEQIDNNVQTVDSDLSKNQTEISPKSTDIYYKGSYEVTLKDLNSSAPVSNKQINFVINKVTYKAVTDSRGVASLKLDLNVGKYSVNAYFTGDDSYQNSSLITSLNIQSTVKAGDTVKYYKATTPFRAQFLTSNGQALSNRQVNIIVNGKTYSSRTDNNGFASLNLNFKPGTYQIISVDPVTGLRVTNTFTVLSTISSSDIKQVAGQNKRFTVKFFKSNGKPLAKKYIKYKFKGKTHKVKTNSHGKISFALKKFKKGTYKITCYNRDGLSKTYIIKIYKRKASTGLSTNSYTFFSNDAKELQVRLSTSLGDNSNSGKLIKIKINGRTYSKVTDGNGMVYLQLPSLNKGLYKVQYSYDGNKFFKSSRSDNYITVLDTSDTSLKVKSTKSFGYGAGTSFKVALTAGGVPLIKKTVVLNIGDKSYSQTTDENGMVLLPINLPIGKYHVTYKFNGDSKLNKSAGACDIDVFKRSGSKLSWACGSSYKDSSQTFDVLLIDMNGNPVFGGAVELAIDGETYNGVTSSDGHARIKTDVAFGKYKISVKFTGNNNFLPSDTSQTVNVELSQFGGGLNQKNAASYLKAYLKSSSHCKVGSAYLKKLVKTLTKGKTNKIDKAKAIFNFVRDKIDYSFYYNSKYGSGGTLKYKKGNCADIAHLLAAMYRTAGFQTRYVHGVCKFNSGHVYGHVWTQVKVGKYWVIGDASDNSNSLGKIKNWNTKSYKIHSKYSSLPF